MKKVKRFLLVVPIALVLMSVVTCASLTEEGSIDVLDYAANNPDILSKATR
jgi:hypothetical protein